MVAKKQSAFFSWRQAVLRSSLPMPTKCLLLVLACHMNDAGEQCFPSIEMLMAETSMGRTAVVKHLRIAVASGWIEVSKHGFAGKKWARNQYHMRWPEDIEGGSPSELPSEAESGEGGSRGELPSQPKAVHVASEGGSRGEIKAVRQVNSSTPNSNSPLPLQGELLPGLNALAWSQWQTYRQRKRKPINPESREAAQRAMCALGDDAAQLAAVDHSIANGYQGLFAPNDRRSPGHGGRHTFDEIHRQQTERIENLEASHGSVSAIPGTAKRVE